VVGGGEAEEREEEEKELCPTLIAASSFPFFSQILLRKAWRAFGAGEAPEVVSFVVFILTG
jgi:hypothetical protein